MQCEKLILKVLNDLSVWADQMDKVNQPSVSVAVSGCQVSGATFSVGESEKKIHGETRGQELKSNVHRVLLPTPIFHSCDTGLKDGLIRLSHIERSCQMYRNSLS